MKLPFIILIDDDEHVLRAIQRDVRNEYRDSYRVSATNSAGEALELITELKRKNETVALFISDQRMPEMEGVVFLEKAKEVYPDAKSVLLTAYSDIEVAIKAINEAGVYKFLLKPLDDIEFKNTIKKTLESLQVIKERDELIRKVKTHEATLKDLEKRYPGSTFVCLLTSPSMETFWDEGIREMRNSLPVLS